MDKEISAYARRGLTNSTYVGDEFEFPPLNKALLSWRYASVRDALAFELSLAPTAS